MEYNLEKKKKTMNNCAAHFNQHDIVHKLYFSF